MRSKKYTVMMAVHCRLDMAMRIVRYAESNGLRKADALRALLQAGLDALDVK